MIRKHIKTIFISLIVGLLFSSISAYAVYSYFASEVSFTPNVTNSSDGWNPGNVETAINDLYTIVNNGGTAENVITGTSVNTKLIGNFEHKIAGTTTATGYNYDTNGLYVFCSYQNNSMVFYSQNKVDVTDYNYMIVKYALKSNHADLTSVSSIGLSSDTSISDSSFVVKKSASIKGLGPSTFFDVLDISSLKGEYYIKGYLHHGSEVQAYTSYLTSPSIVLVK